LVIDSCGQEETDLITDNLIFADKIGDEQAMEWLFASKSGERLTLSEPQQTTYSTNDQ
jgi:hypothetical protein